MNSEQGADPHKPPTPPPEAMSSLRPVGAVVRLWKWACRNKAAALPAAALVVLVVAALAYLVGGGLIRHFELQSACAEAREAFGSGELARALARAREAEALAPEDPEVKDMLARIYAEEEALRGDQAFARYQGARKELDSLCEQVENLSAQCKNALNQKEKLELWRLQAQIESLEELMGRDFIEAYQRYLEALHLVPDDHPRAREHLADLYWYAAREAAEEGHRGDERFYESSARQYAPQKYGASLHRAAMVRLTFFLPPAFAGEEDDQDREPGFKPIEAYLFRFERRYLPPVWVPTPVSPRTGELVAEPLLRATEPYPLLGTSPPPEAVVSAQEVRWRSTFSLPLHPESLIELVPRRMNDSQKWLLSVSALYPRGSYLFYFPPGRGLAETRYLFQVTWSGGCEKTSWLASASGTPPLPPGSEPLLAQGNSFPYGSRDYWLYLSEASGVKTEEFFMARFELVCSQYLAYLNDPAWHNPHQVQEKLPGIGKQGNRREVGWCRDSEGRFQLGASGWKVKTPVSGVSWEAAADYCHWLSSHFQGEWEFRLPSASEWEEAAGGVDERSYPWGTEFDNTFCRMQGSRAEDLASMVPEAVGLFPVDESPYGVRDMAGGVREWTSSVTWANGTRIAKGSSWVLPAPYCRITFHGPIGWKGTDPDIGFRLVAVRTR